MSSGWLVLSHSRTGAIKRVTVRRWGNPRSPRSGCSGIPMTLELAPVAAVGRYQRKVRRPGTCGRRQLYSGRCVGLRFVHCLARRAIIVSTLSLLEPPGYGLVSSAPAFRSRYCRGADASGRHFKTTLGQPLTLAFGGAGHRNRIMSAGKGVSAQRRKSRFHVFSSSIRR
ncbi:hypothetical protein KCP77_07995 [Salmonella enterica subsp. enterica]|nr:hypothetical protein KCP77_07995 [Salmonella enterica subsp. enterica]